MKFPAVLPWLLCVTLGLFGPGLAAAATTPAPRVVPLLNLPAIGERPLRLSGAVLAEIYLGNVRQWNDPAIARLNPDLSLPAQSIMVVRGAIASDDTYVFTRYLSRHHDTWRSRVGEGAAVNWPTGMGSRDMAQSLLRMPGSIGYGAPSLVATNGLKQVQMIDDATGAPAAATAMADVPSSELPSARAAQRQLEAWAAPVRRGHAKPLSGEVVRGSVPEQGCLAFLAHWADVQRQARANAQALQAGVSGGLRQLLGDAAYDRHGGGVDLVFKPRWEAVTVQRVVATECRSNRRADAAVCTVRAERRRVIESADGIVSALPEPPVFEDSAVLLRTASGWALHPDYMTRAESRDFENEVSQPAASTRNPMACALLLPGPGRAECEAEEEREARDEERADAEAREALARNRRRGAFEAGLQHLGLR